MRANRSDEGESKREALQCNSINSETGALAPRLPVTEVRLSSNFSGSLLAVRGSRQTSDASCPRRLYLSLTPSIHRPLFKYPFTLLHYLLNSVLSSPFVKSFFLPLLFPTILAEKTKDFCPSFSSLAIRSAWHRDSLEPDATTASFLLISPLWLTLIALSHVESLPLLCHSLVARPACFDISRDNRISVVYNIILFGKCSALISVAKARRIRSGRRSVRGIISPWSP